MNGWTPADSGAAREITETVLRRAAYTGNFNSSDLEEIADAWMDFAAAR